MNPRLLLIDDHPLFRAGIRLLVQGPPVNAVVVGESSSGGECPDLVRRLQPDLVLLDLHLPDLNGVEVTRLLLAEFPGLKIILLSAETDLAFISQALAAGVSAYLLKSNAPEELACAIASVLAGRLYVCPEITSLLLQDYKQTLAAPLRAPAQPALSGQEQEVLKLLAQGRRMKEIAQNLAISARTVETYRERMMKKLNCKTAAELIRYAVREGIVPL